MEKIRARWWRLLGLFRKNRRDAEMAQEIQHHLDALTERKIAAGMSAIEARQEALREFGGVEQCKELAREQRVWMWPDQFRQDLRFGFRMLRRSPAFSALAILCLILGIGTTTAVFSWIEGILFHPYPAVAHEERMFVLAGTTRGASGFNQLSYPDCVDLEKMHARHPSSSTPEREPLPRRSGRARDRRPGFADYFERSACVLRGVAGSRRTKRGTQCPPLAVIALRLKTRYQFDPEIVGNAI